MTDEVGGGPRHWIADAIVVVRGLAQEMQISKWEVYGFILVGGVCSILAWKAPAIFQAWNERYAVKMSHKREMAKIEAKIQAEKEKRIAKRKGGGSND